MEDQTNQGPQGNDDPNFFPNPILDPQSNDDPAGTDPPTTKTDEPSAGKDGASDDKKGAPEMTPEEYAKGIVPDKDAAYGFAPEAVKAMAPAMQELGLTQEQANALANRFAKWSAEQAQADLQARNARCAEFDKQTQALIKDRPHLAEEARAAMDHYFKERPELTRIFMETELSHDPVILTMLADLGKARLADNGAGTAHGVGSEQAGFAARLSRGVLK